jgi:ADP-ribose pyrophosphatase YjhB (NUDIX family)
MAWIEDSNRRILLVRQASGYKFWTLPGGKVKRGESLVRALKREVREETGLRVEVLALLGVFDRRDKDAITLLFEAVPINSRSQRKHKDTEINKAAFETFLPKKASPSAKFFWAITRGLSKQTPKIRAAS